MNRAGKRSRRAQSWAARYLPAAGGPYCALAAAGAFCLKRREREALFAGLQYGRASGLALCRGKYRHASLARPPSPAGGLRLRGPSTNGLALAQRRCVFRSAVPFHLRAGALPATRGSCRRQLGNQLKTPPAHRTCCAHPVKSCDSRLHPHKLSSLSWPGMRDFMRRADRSPATEPASQPAAAAAGGVQRHRRFRPPPQPASPLHQP